MHAVDLHQKLSALNADYARCIDSDELEKWPDFFLDRCFYKITTLENDRRGYEAGIVYADSRGMLKDRILALRNANIYERQRYRHIVGQSACLSRAGDEAVTETPFVVIRIMRDGKTDVFATGFYRDRVREDETGALRFAERVAICDSPRFETLVAIPF
jgi:3-phenylpropionate/cinnamic acid dioxygenase small subunit